MAYIDTSAVQNLLSATGSGTVADPYVLVVSASSISAGDNNIGNVDIASIAAGENVIGLVGSNDKVTSVTPPLDTNAYASGDLLFDSVAVSNATRTNGGHCILQSVTVLDKSDQGAAFTLVFLNANTDMGTVNGAPNPDDTEASTIVGWVPIATSDYIDVGASKIACVRNIGLGMRADGASTTLYVAGINGTGTPTYAATDLTITLYFKRA